MAVLYTYSCTSDSHDLSQGLAKPHSRALIEGCDHMAGDFNLAARVAGTRLARRIAAAAGAGDADALEYPGGRQGPQAIAVGSNQLARQRGRLDQAQDIGVARQLVALAAADQEPRVVLHTLTGKSFVHHEPVLKPAHDLFVVLARHRARSHMHIGEGRARKAQGLFTKTRGRNDDQDTTEVGLDDEAVLVEGIAGWGLFFGGSHG